jgi:chromosome segregation ATPase
LADENAESRKLDKEFGEAKSRWENERVTLCAKAMKHKARVLRASEELETLGKECDKLEGEHDRAQRERDSMSRRVDRLSEQAATLATKSELLAAE